MNFEHFLERLAKAVGSPKLHPDEGGACIIEWKGESLIFEFDNMLVPNTILVTSPCFLLPKENRERILEEALKCNKMIEETLSQKPDEEVLYLHRRLHPSIGQEELVAILNTFVEDLTTWRSTLDHIAVIVAPSTPPSSIRV